MKKRIVGVNDDEAPPVPIPNTVVKLVGAENTWLATTWEDRTTPALLFFFYIQKQIHRTSTSDIPKQ